MTQPPSPFTVAVCTRDRPDQLRETLAALSAGAPGAPVIVVEQGAPSPAAQAGVRVVRDSGRGLSRARNLALGAAETEWIAFVDDDCVVEPGFGAALAAEIAAHPEVDWVAGHVGGAAPAGDQPPVTTFPVERAVVRGGRRTLPGSIGFGVMFCVRTTVARSLGGWDERLGPGVEPFPAADDMDFNWRLLRSGRRALLTPAVRCEHRQWRVPGEVVALQRGYSRAWAGFAAKHLRRDPLGALWLWGWGVVDVVDMAASAARRRSGLRARIALAKLRGLAEGTALGLRRRW